MNVMQGFRLKLERLGWRMDQPGVAVVALWAVPLLVGLLSLLLRQDVNWDLRNYHLYNPFAFLHGKVGMDLAPAQMQTYFNPTLDVLYYGLTRSLPGQAAGFLLGLIHGLNFLLVYGIARALLPVRPDGAGVRLPLLLALAGMCGAAFVSEVGNVMGDNLTSLFVLGSVLVLLWRWPQLAAHARGAAAALLLAGLLMGLGVGLKLTVAVFALALCLALLVLPLPLLGRVRAAFLYGIGVLAGMAITGGHWYWKMWNLFGNPLFPQFNHVFKGPLAGPMAVGDLRFLPHGVVEKLLWPFLFVLDPLRVSEIKIRALIWPVLYVVFIALALAALLRRRAAPAADAPARGPFRLLLAFFALSYLIWLNLFSIYRYLVPLELLAPLMLWLAAQTLWPRAAMRGAVVLVLLAAIAAAMPPANWGRVGWSAHAFRADVPAIAQPERSMVYMVGAPLGWLVTMFPDQLAFVALGAGFPESDAYRQRIAAMAAARPGTHYVMFDASGAALDAGLDPAARAQGLAADQASLDTAVAVMAGYGLTLDPASCATHPAWMGDHRYHYRLCTVARRG